MAQIRVNISIDENALALIDELAEEHTDGDRSAWIAHAATRDIGKLSPKQWKTLQSAIRQARTLSAALNLLSS